MYSIQIDSAKYAYFRLEVQTNRCDITMKPAQNTAKLYFQHALLVPPETYSSALCLCAMMVLTLYLYHLYCL